MLVYTVTPPMRGRSWRRRRGSGKILNNSHVDGVFPICLLFSLSLVLEDFEELDRAYQKSKKVIEAEGFPRFVVRCLADLEDFVAELWEDKEARKKMSKLNSKGNDYNNNAITTIRDPP